ncbi:MAG: DUF4440 domain-containing protein [Methyloligellaceae bacterium]
MHIHNELDDLHARTNDYFNNRRTEDYLRCFSEEPQLLISGYPLIYTREGLQDLMQRRIEDGHQEVFITLRYAQQDDDLAYAIGDWLVRLDSSGEEKHYQWMSVYECSGTGNWKIKSLFAVEITDSTGAACPDLFNFYKVFHTD